MRARAVFALTAASLAAPGVHSTELPTESLLKMANAIVVITESYLRPVDPLQLQQTCHDAYSRREYQKAPTEQKEQLCFRAMSASLDKLSSYIGPEDFAAVRVPLPPERGFKSERRSDGTLFIQPGQLTDLVLTQLAGALRAVDSQPPVTRIVLDLRHCEGGALTSVVGLVAAFLPSSAMVFRAQGRALGANLDAYARPEYYGRGTDPFAGLPAKAKELPMAVLVDADTAAGAEIVAGALQDYQRALVIGQRTMGIGTLQTVKLLTSHQGLKLTTAIVSRPKGGSIDGVGIAPDVATTLTGPDLVSLAVWQLSSGR